MLQGVRSVVRARRTGCVSARIQGPRIARCFLCEKVNDVKDPSSENKKATAGERNDRSTETRRGLTAKLLETLLSSKDEVPKDVEEPKKKSALDFLEGPRLDIFPNSSDLSENSVPTEDEHVESWRQKLDKLSSGKELEALQAMSRNNVTYAQEYYGDKYGNLSDPFNRKMYDNDVNAAPDIRRNCAGKHNNMALEDQIEFFNKMILESGATNKLELCRALPLLMCSTKWSLAYKGEVLLEHMEGVEDSVHQQRRRRRLEMNQNWFARVRAKKEAAKAEAARIAAANLYDLQKERNEELEHDEEEEVHDWLAEAEAKRKANIAKKASARASHFNRKRKAKSEAKQKRGGRR